MQDIIGKVTINGFTQAVTITAPCILMYTHE